jgi:hypothetical protein
MWMPKKYTVDKSGFSVYLEDPKSKLCFWVDVWIDERYHDVEADWNQTMFFLNDEEDLVRRDIQDNSDNFDDAASTAISYLEDKGVIYQDDSANWFRA